MDHSLAAYFRDDPADSSILWIFHRVLKTVDAIYAAGSSPSPLSPETIRLDNSDQAHIQSSIRRHEADETIAFGSAKYSAPEVFLQNGDSCSGEPADCYVLGFVFYEILIGNRAFAAQFASLENGPPSLWLKWHADKTMKARPLTELRPSLGHFASVIDEMMEKDPSKRVSSISQVLRAFSSVDAQTTYNAGPAVQGPAPLKTFARIETWVASRLAIFRKPRIAAAVLLAIAILTSAALLTHHEISSRNIRQPMPVALPPPGPPASEASPIQVPALPPATDQNADIQPPLPSPGLKLQVESHLEPGTLLFVDDLPPMALSQNRLFTEKVTPGPHKFRVVSGSKAFLKLQLDIAAEGDISFVELPKTRSLRYLLLASNANSAKLYGTSDATVGLPGHLYEPVPREGRIVPSDQVLNVSFGKNAQTDVHLNLLPAGSIRIVLEPPETPLLVPVEISANVPDADILINGVKLKHKLDNGVHVVRLRAGDYRVKLVHADYHDSDEQNLVIGGTEERRELQFTLAPVVSASNPANNPVVAHDSAAAGLAADVEGQAIKPFGKVTFHVRPETAQISARPQQDSRAQDCSNNQPCLLPAGAYDVTARAEGFKTEVKRITVGAGDEKPFEWKLEALVVRSALNPADFFENGQTWIVDAKGWWTHTQAGYSFMRANQGVFAFDILQPSGLFASRKVSLVVNYKGESSRVLYTIDQHKLRRNARSPGVQIADYSIANEVPPQADYRLTVELLSDRVIIRNAAGQILDNLALANAAAGKVGFSGKVKLKVIQTDRSSAANPAN